jgi:hypothetical protein
MPKFLSVENADDRGAAHISYACHRYSTKVLPQMLLYPPL